MILVANAAYCCRCLMLCPTHSLAHCLAAVSSCCCSWLNNRKTLCLTMLMPAWG
jgi:hypothetical protein